MEDRPEMKAWSNYHFQSIIHEEPFIIYQLQSSKGTGNGEMRCLTVLPGITLSYDCLDLDSCWQPCCLREDFIQINYCVEGCYEVEQTAGRRVTLGKGDLCVSVPGRQCLAASWLPTCHYRGMTLIIEMQKAQPSIDRMFPVLNLSLSSIFQPLINSEELCLIRGCAKLEHCFVQFQDIDEEIREGYLTLKTMEIMLILKQAIGRAEQSQRCFSAFTLRQTEAVYLILNREPLTRMPISKLAADFHLSPTNLQQCFKALYGLPIGCFLKQIRIHRAVSLMQEHPEETLGEIAQQIGYENQSKFSSAFKAVMGKTPLHYRRGLQAAVQSEQKQAGSEQK